MLGRELGEIKTSNDDYNDFVRRIRNKKVTIN